MKCHGPHTNTHTRPPPWEAAGPLTPCPPGEAAAWREPSDRGDLFLGVRSLDPNRPSLEDQKHIASFLWQDNFERAWGQSSPGVGWTCAPKGGNALASCSAPLERRAFLPHSAHVPRSLEVTLRSGRVNEVLHSKLSQPDLRCP